MTLTDAIGGVSVVLMMIYSCIVSVQNTYIRHKYEQIAWAADTVQINYVQQRALYEECMWETHRIPAGKPVDRRLNNEVPNL